LSFGGLEKARLFYFFDCFTKSLVVFSDDSPTPFPPLLPSIYLSLPPPLATECRVEILLYILFARLFLPSQLGFQTSVVAQVTTKNGLASVRCTWFLPLVILFCHPFFFFFCYFVSLHGVWWAWDGSLLFFVSPSLYHYYPHPLQPGVTTTTSYLLPLPIYLDTPLFYGWSRSAHDIALSFLFHLLGAMGLHGTMWASSGGFGVWAERVRIYG
jgi:hypothetical protein